jgi:hypothetical protein
MTSPVLLIIFNRPDTTAQVFEAIRKAKPGKLYVSADAPRPGNEKDSVDCEATRKIVLKVDWECDVHYRFLDQNLGCGYGPASAISWAFENEDRLIVLEDDCVPSLPFFDYCYHCLERFCDDERVWLVSGRSHHEDSPHFQNQDYIFSHYGHTWGWATWKRCWDHFDIDMKKWDRFHAQGGFLNSYYSEKEGKFQNSLFAKLSTEENISSHAWDYQWLLAIQANGGLSITPSKNLIHNIGSFGTHSDGQLKCHTLPASEEFKVTKEPDFVLANREYDQMHFNSHVYYPTSLIPRAVKKMLRILGQ